MMNKLVLGFFVFLAGCSQLMRGQEQPIITKNESKGIYFTTCAGAVEDWPNCYEKASRTCNGKYDVITREDNNRGTKRELTFQCKK
jgi:hypothetical protein